MVVQSPCGGVVHSVASERGVSGALRDQVAEAYPRIRPIRGPVRGVASAPSNQGEGGLPHLLGRGWLPTSRELTYRFWPQVCSRVALTCLGGGAGLRDAECAGPGPGRTGGIGRKRPWPVSPRPARFRPECQRPVLSRRGGPGSRGCLAGTGQEGRAPLGAGFGLPSRPHRSVGAPWSFGFRFL